MKQGSGVVLTLSTPESRMAGQGVMGYGVTCGAIETFSRILAGEHDPHGFHLRRLKAIPVHFQEGVHDHQGYPLVTVDERVVANDSGAVCGGQIKDRG